MDLINAFARFLDPVVREDSLKSVCFDLLLLCYGTLGFLTLLKNWLSFEALNQVISQDCVAIFIHQVKEDKAKRVENFTIRPSTKTYKGSFAYQQQLCLLNSLFLFAASYSFVSQRNSHVILVDLQITDTTTLVRIWQNADPVDWSLLDVYLLQLPKILLSYLHADNR